MATRTSLACIALALGAHLLTLSPARAASPAVLAPSQAAALIDEVDALVSKIKSGNLKAMTDEQLIKVFTQLNPQAAMAYLEQTVRALGEYELWMRREERLPSGWTTPPFVNYIKYRHQPRQVYVQWVKGSPKAGQEIIFDETKRKDAIYGHLGGLLNITSMWTSMDGLLARGNSNHTVRDLGLQPIVEIIANENRQRLKEGYSSAPNVVEVLPLNGERTVALTWITPPGVTKAYSRKARIFVDIGEPMIRQIETWDDRGDMIERIAFDKLVPKRFTDADFDPKNPDYGF
jgi:hypothetical protein